MKFPCLEPSSKGDTLLRSISDHCLRRENGTQDNYFCDLIFFVILQFWDLQFCNFAIPRPRDFVILWFCHFVILSFLDFAIWAIAISEIHNESNRKHAISTSRACKCNANINKEHWKSIFEAWLYSLAIIRLCNFEEG